jgi:hypothetical protein
MAPTIVIGSPGKKNKQEIQYNAIYMRGPNIPKDNIHSFKLPI